MADRISRGRKRKFSVEIEDYKMEKHRTEAIDLTQDSPKINNQQGPLECSICYDTISLRGVLDCCDHSFCFDCIEHWSKGASTCPVCRQIFRTIEKKAPGTESQGQVTRVPQRQYRAEPDTASIVLEPQEIEYLFQQGMGHVALQYMGANANPQALPMAPLPDFWTPMMIPFLPLHISMEQAPLFHFHHFAPPSPPSPLPYFEPWRPIEFVDDDIWNIDGPMTPPPPSPPPHQEEPIEIIEISSDDGEQEQEAENDGAAVSVAPLILQLFGEDYEDEGTNNDDQSPQVDSPHFSAVDLNEVADEWELPSQHGLVDQSPPAGTQNGDESNSEPPVRRGPRIWVPRRRLQLEESSSEVEKEEEDRTMELERETEPPHTQEPQQSTPLGAGQAPLVLDEESDEEIVDVAVVLSASEAEQPSPKRQRKTVARKTKKEKTSEPDSEDESETPVVKKRGRGRPKKNETTKSAGTAQRRQRSKRRPTK